MAEHQHLTFPGSDRVVQVSDWHRVVEKLSTDPHAVTNFDFQIIESFDGPQGVERALETRRRAIAERPVHSPLQRDADRNERAQQRLAARKARRAAEEQSTGQTPTAPIDNSDFGALVKAILLLREFCSDMNERNKERNTRLDALEKALGAGNSSEEVRLLKARVATLEGRPTMRYRGVWLETEKYSIGDFVTLGGSVWHCNLMAPVSGARPGIDHRWTLAVKSGRDGKAAR